MTRRWTSLLAVVLSACAGVGGTSSVAPAAPEAHILTPVSTLPTERVEAIDRLLSRFEALGMFSGVVTIDQGGRIVFQRAYGFADYDRRIPFNERTIFRIASVSKSMTDAALAAMIARGQIRMDDTVSRFLPDFPNGERITIEQIVTHRSGIAHTNRLPWGDATEFMTLDEIVGRLAQTPLDFEPGARENYSNGGYAVLTKVMEVAAGKPYAELMRELVFDPVGMPDSGVIVDSRIERANSARGYEPGIDVTSRRAPRLYLPETRPGGGSLYASASDVVRFYQSAIRGRLEGADAAPSLFGDGWGGRSPGFYFDIYSDREADMIVVSASNNYAVEINWADNIARLALGQPPLFDAPDVDLARPADAAWIGNYLSDGATVTLSRGANGQLIFVDTDGDVRALIPLADGGYLEPLRFGICRMPDPDHIVCGRISDDQNSTEFVRRP